MFVRVCWWGWSVLAWGWLTLFLRTQCVPTYSKEVCQNEHFHAVCPPGHVILMTSVLYGRMRFGKCVKTNFGFVGCYNDVTGHVHRRCSGRQACTIRIPDSGMERTNPCNNDLKSYLEANYTCIKVTTKGRDANELYHNTYNPCSLQLEDSNPQIYLIHSQQLGKTQPKYSTCSLSWLVSARAGQRISIELYDFSTIPALVPANNSQPKTSRQQLNSNFNRSPQSQQSAVEPNLKAFPLVNYHNNAARSNQAPVSNVLTQDSPPSLSPSSSSADLSPSPSYLQQKLSSHCIVSVANVHDLINVTASVETYDVTPSYTLCGSDLGALDVELKSILKERTAKMKILETWVQAYESRGSSIRLEMLKSHLSDTVYLLKLEATGCPAMDGTFSDDVSVTQHDVSTLKIECKKSGRVVYLFCNGTKWNGTVSDCDSIDTAFSTQMEGSGIFSFGTVTLVGLILIWSVALSILVLGLYYLRRKRMKKNKQGSDIGLRDLKPLNSQDAMYDVTNQDIYAKNQAFETPPSNTKLTPSSPDSKRSPSKVSNPSPTLPPNTPPPSAVAILLPSRKTTSLMASKTRPAAIEFCTRVWQSPETSRRSRDALIDYPRAPVMTFHPTVSRRQQHHMHQLQLTAPQQLQQQQQQQQQLVLNDYQQKEPQLPYSPHTRQPQMLGLRAVWIDNGECCGGYQNSVVNQTYSLPDKSGKKLKASNVVVLSQCNEYENDDDKDGYIQQRRLPLPPSPNAPLLTLAFRNATYNTWNASPVPTSHHHRSRMHYGNGSAFSDLDNDVN